MVDRTYRDWPFFTDRHRNLAAELDAWATRYFADATLDHTDPDTACRTLAAALGDAGFLNYAVPPDGAAGLDGRSLCLIREILAYHDGLADFAFAMQGLGTGAVTLFGTEAQKASILPGVRAGRSLAAFALSEPDAGSDVAALALSATPVAGGWSLNGTKTWISNGGIAGHYVVFARTGGTGTKGISAFLVEAGQPGLDCSARLAVMAPHPLARLEFRDCIVPTENLIGALGDGFKIAMATLDIFRPTVGAAALGFARRAYGTALDRVTRRAMFGGRMADLPLVQAKLADMAVAIDTSALMVYRAAWQRDRDPATRTTREAAMAKLVATEAAQGVIDAAVQLMGAIGVQSGTVVEGLYREIRALRIYEGASEVQKLIIARQELGARQESGAVRV